ncbi:Pentatricopeptide repeat-containing protein At3g59040 [Linum perenne]
MPDCYGCRFERLAILTSVVNTPTDMAATVLSLKPFVSSNSSYVSQTKPGVYLPNFNVKIRRKLEVVAKGMLSQRKFMQRRKKVEVFKDSADEADQKNWRRLMNQIVDTGSAVSVLRGEKVQNQAVHRHMVLGTLMRFKQLKKWNIVIEILEWLRSQQWWDFNERDFILLITAYGKQGDFNRAEQILSVMNKRGYKPNVVSHTALMEAYGKGGKHKNAEAIFRRMQALGPEPSALTYQIILKMFVEANKFKEAEEVFESLLNVDKPPLKPDQRLFHLMIYMHKKAGNYEQARKLFGIMAERGVPQSTITYNSLMSFGTNYKEVSKIYDQMQRSGLQPDVVSYSLLINAYGKARREDEALAVFEDMLDAGVRPSLKSYNILLDAFAISGMVEQAKIVFKSMRRDRITPDICSYATMLLAYVNADDMDGAEKFFTRMVKQDGLKPDVITYGTLMKGYGKATNIEKMMKKFEEMKSAGIRPNQTIFTTIMDAHGKNDFASAVTWYKEMESLGIHPDQKAKNILLSLAKTEEDQKEAGRVVGLTDNSATPLAFDGTSRLPFEYDEDDDDEDDDDDDDDDESGFGEKQEESSVLSSTDVGFNVVGLHNLSVVEL